MKDTERLKQKIELKDNSGMDYTKELEEGLEIICSRTADPQTDQEIKDLETHIDQVILSYTGEKYAGLPLHKYELVCQASIAVLKRMREESDRFTLLEALIALDTERTAIHAELFDESQVLFDCTFFSDQTYHPLTQPISEDILSQWIGDWIGLFSHILEAIQRMDMEAINSSIIISLIFLLDIDLIMRALK